MRSKQNRKGTEIYIDHEGKRNTGKTGADREKGKKATVKIISNKIYSWKEIEKIIQAKN